MKWLQKLGKSLMLPVAVLPVAGILSGIGYWLCPAVMQGGDITGTIPMIGYFLTQAALALIDGAIIALLFAVGVAVGMSDDHDGTAGLAGLVSWLMITHLLSPGVVQTLAGIAPDSIQGMAFAKIQNALIGIIAGVIGATCYNKFKNTRLPDWLAFFSGKRCVAIVTALFSVIAAAILLFVWPIVFGGLTALGQSIAKMGAVGAGLYAFLNRLLIPFGLHHALNNVFWFDTIGLGDLSHFWAGDTSANVSWSLGMYMSGFFPCMMFGVPGAALAIVHCAKDNKKSRYRPLWRPAASVHLSAALQNPLNLASCSLHLYCTWYTLCCTVFLPTSPCWLVSVPVSPSPQAQQISCSQHPIRLLRKPG